MATGPYGSQGNSSGYAGRDLLLDNGTGQFTSATDPDLLDALAAAKKLDPNASIQSNGTSGGQETFSIKGQNGMGYGLGAGQTLAQTPEEQAQWNQYQVGLKDGGGILHNVADRSKVTHDNQYGDVTSQDNIQNTYIPEKKTALDILGPMAPLLLAGGVGAFEGLGDLATSAIKGGIGTFSNMMQGGKLDPFQMAIGALGNFTGGMGLPPEIAAAAKYLPMVTSAINNPQQTAINAGMNAGLGQLMKYISGGG